MTLGIVLVATVALGALLIITWSLLTGISPLPSNRATREVMVSLVPSGLRGDVHELGAGWGGLALAVARQCPEATVFAWERSPLPALVLALRARWSGLPNLRVRWSNFMNAELQGASAVLCYLWTGGMQALEPKLRAELRPGALVISNTFALRPWVPKAELQVPDLFRSRVYCYEV